MNFNSENDNKWLEFEKNKTVEIEVIKIIKPSLMEINNFRQVCEKKSNEYHCEHLRRILMRCANKKLIETNKSFDNCTSGGSSSGEDWEIEHHIKHLFNDPIASFGATIKFNDAYVKYRTNK